MVVTGGGRGVVVGLTTWDEVVAPPGGTVVSTVPRCRTVVVVAGT